MLSVDQVLHERYRIVRQLGHGGMGAVYEAIDERFGEPIALKEVVFASPSESQRELVAKAFEREAKALAKAHHEVIPYVRDYFSEVGRQFLVMELVPGDDLAELLTKRHEPFPLVECLKWLDQLLDALDYLHTLERPIIHRDIKPQNLKLNSRGKIKLLDFGIAKSAESAAATLSNQTFVGATLDYSPIEQILRAIDPTFREYILLKHRERAEEVLSQTTDARCDIYALGATFYHLLTNQTPPDAVKRTLETWEDRTDPLRIPSEVNPILPARISACILRAMALRREDRFDSASAMRAAMMMAVAENKTLENSVYNESWEAEQVRLQMAADARKQELELMRAETAVLPSSGKELVPPAGTDESTPDFQSLPTERLPAPPPITDQHGEPAANETLPLHLVNTVPSGNVSGIEVTERLRKAETADRIEEPQRPEPLADTQPSGRRSGLLWALAAVLFIFGLGGIAAAIWVLSPEPTATGGAAGNVNLSASPTPPTETPVPATPEPSPTAPVSEERKVLQPAATPRPTQITAPTPVRIPERTPRPTPVTTPKGTPPPRKTPDPNCIYNNTCK